MSSECARLLATFEKDTSYNSTAIDLPSEAWHLIMLFFQSLPVMTNWTQNHLVLFRIKLNVWLSEPHPHRTIKNSYIKIFVGGFGWHRMLKIFSCSVSAWIWDISESLPSTKLLLCKAAEIGNEGGT